MHPLGCYMHPLGCLHASFGMLNASFGMLHALFWMLNASFGTDMHPLGRNMHPLRLHKSVRTFHAFITVLLLPGRGPPTSDGTGICQDVAYISEDSLKSYHCQDF